MSILDAYDRASPALGIAAPIIAALVEHRYKVVSRAKRLCAKALNLEGHVQCQLQYRAVVPFEIVKTAIRNHFRSMPNFKVDVDERTRFVFYSDIFSITAIAQDGAVVVFEVRETACGMWRMKRRVLRLVESINKLAEGEDAPLRSFERAEIQIRPPVRWPEVSARPPRKFALESYAVTMRYDNSNTRLVITMSGDLAIQSDSYGLISTVLERLI